MLNPEPQAQHRWLQQLLGDWTCESTCDAGSGEPPMTTTGTELVRQLGELWVPGEGTGSMPGGGDARTLITLGFDTEKEAFIGTWIGSMATHMWVYRGTLDATEKGLPLETVGPSFTGDGSTARYRDTITLIGPSERMLTSATQQPDGSWKEFMKATYRPKPPEPAPDMALRTESCTRVALAHPLCRGGLMLVPSGCRPWRRVWPPRWAAWRCDGCRSRSAGARVK